MRYFLTFENNYRVYWAWTKYRISAPIGQISRPNHQPEPASLWLVDGGGRLKWQYWSILCLRSVIIIMECLQCCWSREVVWRGGDWSWVLCVAQCGRTMVTQGHGNLSFSSTQCCLTVPAFSPHDRLYRVTTTRWDKTMITNNKQPHSGNINIFLPWDCWTCSHTLWHPVTT